MIPLSLGFSEGRSKAVNDGRCVNVYPCVNQSDAKSPFTLSERPGLKPFARPTADDGEVKSMVKVGDLLYSVIKDKFLSTDVNTLVSTELGTLTDAKGRAWIERNANSQIMIATGEIGYVYDWSTALFGQIADDSFPGAVSLTFQDQYGVTVDPDSGRLRNSALNDFTDWEATNFVTAEAAPDNLLSIISDHQEIIGLGEYTTEIYSNVGDVAAVFQRLQGGFLEIGVNAPQSIAKVTNVVLWLDDRLQVRLLESYSPSIVSSPAISYQLQKLSRTDDAIGMAHIWNGHAFYILTFPTAERTFVYDITASAAAGTALWHELSSYPLDSANRWRGNSLLQSGDVTYIGDYSNGWIYTLDEDTHTDNLQPMQRIWTTSSVQDIELRRALFHHELELEVEPGVGTDDEDLPEVAMQYSDDGGNTWSNELVESIGSIGEYKNRARWHGLGESRNRIYMFTISDNVKVEVVGVYLRATMGTH
jgi:hypothetical protein